LNTEIWDAVCETDPKFTKGFKRGGGFSGTSTNSTYLHHKATKLWGPCGKGWGYEVVDEKYVDGAVHDDGRDIIHVVRVRLWYCDRDTYVEQYGQTEFVSKNKYGWKTDEEAPKKSLTDGVSKCLAALGFSADIFQGLYDDNKYVAAMEQKFAEVDHYAELRKFFKAAGCKTVADADAVVKWLTGGKQATAKAIADADEHTQAAVLQMARDRSEPTEKWLELAKEG